jgi:hypothetical protein
MQACPPWEGFKAGENFNKTLKLGGWRYIEYQRQTHPGCVEIKQGGKQPPVRGTRAPGTLSSDTQGLNKAAARWGPPPSLRTKR